MFDNIGGKIKVLAKVLCWIGIAASLILCIVISIGSNSRNPTVLIGLAVLIAGCIGSWVGSFFMYGFGQLIEDTSAIRESLRRQSQSSNTSSNHDAVASQYIPATNSVLPKTSSAQNAKGSSQSWVCKSCGLHNRAGRVCVACGEDSVPATNSVSPKPSSAQNAKVSSQSWVCKSCGLHNRAGRVCVACGEDRA